MFVDFKYFCLNVNLKGLVYCLAKNNGRNSIFKVARRYRNVSIFFFKTGDTTDALDIKACVNPTVFKKKIE